MKKKVATHERNFVCQEEDILDMIAECESDEKEGKYYTNAGTRPPRGPKVS